MICTKCSIIYKFVEAYHYLWNSLYSLTKPLALAHETHAPLTTPLSRKQAVAGSRVSLLRAAEAEISPAVAVVVAVTWILLIAIMHQLHLNSLPA